MNAHRNAPGAAALGLLAGALLLAVAPGAVTAQESDARWLPWLGCWEAADEVADDSMLCIRPVQGDVGVEMLTVAGGEITSSEIVRADGVQHETEREGCRGWESAAFSADRRRVYLKTDHLCDGGVQRVTSGVIAMLSPNEWVDVRGVEYSGRTLAGVVRYRLATADRAEAVGLGDIARDRALAVRTARMAAAAELTVEDVIEASREIDEEVVLAWVAERGAPLEVDAQKLVRMADAGVSPEVIDVVVAVSYPERFAVDQDADVREARDDWASDRGYRHPYYRPFFGDPFFYSPYGYGYNRYGYGYGGYYGGGYYRPVVVVVQPKDQGVVGRIVNGRGYTRGRGSSGSDGPSGSSGPTRSSAGSSGGDKGSSSAGSSGGSSTGRKAKPRGGGGREGGA